VKRALRADLEKLKGLAFERVADRRELVEGYHGLSKAARQRPDFFWVEKIYGWAFVPLSLWPVDLRGFGLHILGAVKAGRELDDPTRAACKLFQHPPAEAVCKAVSEYEQRIKTGNYNEVERRAEAERAQAWWEQAEKVGLKGDQRNQWVMGRLGWDPRTDDSKLRRLLRDS
jgi:hypothetical protein